MTCCRCNRSGICRNCLCVRDGIECTSCLPKRLGQCQNVQPEYSLETNDARENDTDQSLVTTSQNSRTIETNTDAVEDEIVSRNQVECVLPPFSPANPPNFTWGEMDGVKVAEDIDRIYSEIVHWRHNVFKIPSGKQGKAFVYEMARLFNAYAEASSMEGVAIKAAMVFQH